MAESMAESALHFGGESSSSSATPIVDKPVIVRVKRRTSQSPVDALWLEICERPSKRPLVDLEKLSLSDSNSSAGIEALVKRVFVQHVQTVDSSIAAIDVLQLFAQPGVDIVAKARDRANTLKDTKKQHQLLAKAKQGQEALAKSARFEQIWRSRREKREVVQDEKLGQAFRLFDIICIDSSETCAAGHKEHREKMSDEDRESLAAFLPLLREYIPSAAEEIEADIRSYVSELGTKKMHPMQEEFVYDLYAVKEDVNETDTVHPYPLVQVNDDDEFYDGPDNSDYESDDSNAENHPLNDYPDEESEADQIESETSGDDSEEQKSEGHREDDDDGDDREAFNLSRDPLEDDGVYTIGYDDYKNDMDLYSDETDDEDRRWANKEFPIL